MVDALASSHDDHTLSISFDGQRWLATDAARQQFELNAAEAGLQGLPELPEGSSVSALLLPVELLLSRTFSLPLSHVRFVDQDILAQELEDNSAEQADAWWLAWQAGLVDASVQGLMFGLPEGFRQQLDGHEAWQHIRYVGIDACARLDAQRRALAPADGEALLAVFDADAEGVFFGLWSGGESGFWRGVRRLNWPDSAMGGDMVRENIRRSLQSMGWQGDSAVGRLPAALQAALQLPSWQGDVLEIAALPGRQEANLMLYAEPAAGLSRGEVPAALMNSAGALNFRHGRWRASTQFGQLKPWYRSMALVALITVLWACGMAWQNYQLESQLQLAQQRVIAAFHKGLPQEKVLIDAMAQLRKAAGGSGDGKQGNSAAQWLQQMAVIHKVYQQTPWQMRSLSFQHGRMNMSGRVKDLQAMNRIRAALEQESGATVKIEDTDLSGQQVIFRMTW